MKKWYFPVFSNLNDVAVMNALYCMTNDNIPCLEFRRRIVTASVTISSSSKPKKLSRSSLNKASAKHLPYEIRKNLTGHILEKNYSWQTKKICCLQENHQKTGFKM